MKNDITGRQNPKPRTTKTIGKGAQEQQQKQEEEIKTREQIKPGEADKTIRMQIVPHARSSPLEEKIG